MFLALAIFLRNTGNSVILEYMLWRLVSAMAAEVKSPAQEIDFINDQLEKVVPVFD